MLVLDQAHFDDMTAGDRALQVEVVGLFRMQVQGWRGAFTLTDGWRDAVHTLKGSARGIGLQNLAGACEIAENASQTEVAAALSRVTVALDEALAALEQFAAEAA